MTLRTVGFVATTDLDRARLFYQGELGFRVLEESPVALVCDGFRVTKVESFEPQPFTVLGWEVDDLDAALDARAGLELVRYDGMGQDERGIWTAPGGARIAWFRDPDGNLLSLTQQP